MNENILEIKNISKTYNNFKLDDVSFYIPKGSIVGLVGENGAGKSTTIKAILNILKTETGTIQVFGKDNSDVKLKDDIGVVFDDCSFPEVLNAKEVNIIMKHLYKNWEKDTFNKYMKTFGLNEKQPIKEYSRGMRMKLSIAVALSHGAKLLILDEATSGLDPVVRDDVLDVLLEFIQDEERGILMSSHILSDLEKACDYIVFIHDGKVFLQQPKDELMEKFVIAKCGKEEFDTLTEDQYERFRENKFGVELLMSREQLIDGMVYDKASIEDIMLFYMKGQKK